MDRDHKTTRVVILSGKRTCENCKTVLNEHVPDQCPECGREFKREESNL